MNEIEIAIQRLRLINAEKIACDDDFVKLMLAQKNPIIKQWAIAAANHIKDQDAVILRVFEILNDDGYYDVRIYALCYLARHNCPIQISLLDKFLEQAVTARQKAMIYNALAISRPDINSLKYLKECSGKETDTDAKRAIETNILKIAKHGLINDSIDKEELKNKFPDIYRKTKEGRLEKDIQEKLQENLQSNLFEVKTNFPDFSETPEKSMQTIEEENYINDLVEFGNEEFIQKRVYIRDLNIIGKFKKNINECNVCGLDNIPLDAHHIIPLKSGGSDLESNMVCVCSNCHRRFHAGQIIKIGEDLYELINHKDEKAILNSNLNVNERYLIYSNHFFNHLLLMPKF